MDLSSDTFTQDVEKLEYYYRRGRVAQALEKTSEAISFYNLTLQKGSSNSAYFAFNAALNLGLIYEKQGEKVKGLNYDLAFNWSDEEWYCSELVYKMYKNVFKIELAQPKALKTFDLSNPAVKEPIF